MRSILSYGSLKLEVCFSQRYFDLFLVYISQAIVADGVHFHSHHHHQHHLSVLLLPLTFIAIVPVTHQSL